jgi:aspartate/methionine/tyrosine aminotransferase
MASLRGSRRFFLVLFSIKVLPMPTPPVPGCFASLDLRPNALEEARRRAAAGAGYLDLTSSNPTRQGLLFPPEVLRAAAAPYWESRRYEPDPRGSPAARAAIAAYYATRTPPLALSHEAIYITASTSEAYSLLFALLTDPGDNLLAPDVSYPLFDFLAEIHRIELRPYHLDERCAWQIDPDTLRAQATDHTRGVLIVSPHNPTGAIVGEPLPALEQLGLPLICDEVFAAFTYQQPAAPPVAALHPNLPVFHLNGISKLFALPDLKLGWMALNAPALERWGERLEVLNDTFLGANSLTQAMLPTLFAQGVGFVETMTERVRANFDLALQRLAASPLLDVPPPDGGYYLFPRVWGWEDDEALALHLLQQGVLVYPGSFYGDMPGAHIMLSALTAPATFQQGIARLCAALEGG